MAARKKDIELLPREEWEKSSFGKILKWVLSVGRYIVIGTELVVILAFISRFKLDHDLTNLYEDIKQKQAIIEANREFEEKFRFLQKRVSAIEELEIEQSSTANILEELVALIPIDVSLSSLKVSQSQISLGGNSLSETGLASFLNNLKTSPQFENLVLSNVSSGKKTGIEFQLKSDYKPIKS